MEIYTDTINLAASKSQIIRSVGKKDSESGFKRRGHVSAPKDTKSSLKSGISQERLSVLEEESFPLENFENNQGNPQQVRDFKLPEPGESWRVCVWGKHKGVLIIFSIQMKIW